MNSHVWNYKKIEIYKAKILGNLGGAHRSITEELLFKKPKFKFPLGLVNTCQVQAASTRNAGMKTWGLSDLVNPDFPLKSHLKNEQMCKNVPANVSVILNHEV